MAELKVGLAVGQGLFEGMPKAWWRWCEVDGTLLLTDTEAALQGEALAQQRQQQAELQVHRTALNLCDMGLPIAQISQITGLAAGAVVAIVGAIDKGT